MSKKESVDAASMHPIVHTPGPWIVDHVVRTFTPNCTSSVFLIKRKDRRDVDVPTWLAELSDRENSHKDAKLIAAAPDLLEALRELANEVDVHFLCTTEKMSEAMRQAYDNAFDVLGKVV